jgi:hypothetical protein
VDPVNERKRRKTMGKGKRQKTQSTTRSKCSSRLQEIGKRNRRSGRGKLGYILDLAKQGIPYTREIQQEGKSFIIRKSAILFL